MANAPDSIFACFDTQKATSCTSFPACSRLVPIRTNSRYGKRLDQSAPMPIIACKIYRGHPDGMNRQIEIPLNTMMVSAFTKYCWSLKPVLRAQSQCHHLQDATLPSANATRKNWKITANSSKPWFMNAPLSSKRSAGRGPGGQVWRREISRPHRREIRYTNECHSWPREGSSSALKPRQYNRAAQQDQCGQAP